MGRQNVSVIAWYSVPGYDVLGHHTERRTAVNHGRHWHLAGFQKDLYVVEEMRSTIFRSTFDHRNYINQWGDVC